MNEFFDAHICQCPHCETQFLSCEGPECDCMEQIEPIVFIAKDGVYLCTSCTEYAQPGDEIEHGCCCPNKEGVI